MRPLVIAVFCLMALMFPTGCGKNVDKTCKVTGTVLLDDKPLPEGNILFEGIDGDVPVSGKITDGNFAVVLKPGMKKVRINSYKNTGKAASPMYKAEDVPEQINLIPARYNTATTLNEDIPSTISKTFQFEIQSKP